MQPESIALNLKEFCIHRSTNHKPRTLKQLKGNLCSDRTRVPLQQLGNLLNAAKHNVCCAPCLHCGAKRHSDIAFGRIRSNQFRALCCNLKNKSGLRLVRTCAYNKCMHILAVPNRYMQLSAVPQPPQYTCISQGPRWISLHAVPCRLCHDEFRHASQSSRTAQGTRHFLPRSS